MADTKGRTVKPDGEAVKRLRQAKGWRVEDLADKAACSARTVENVERGSSAYQFTLVKIAQALGVEYATLLSEPPPAPVARKSKTLKATLTVAVDFDGFDETDRLDKLMDRIEAVIGAMSWIEVKAVREGNSVEIEVELTEADYIRLRDAFRSGRLDDLRIQEIKTDLEGWQRFLPEMPKEEAQPKPTEPSLEEPPRPPTLPPHREAIPHEEDLDEDEHDY